MSLFHSVSALRFPRPARIEITLRRAMAMAAAMILMTLTGCEQSEGIQTYTIPKKVPEELLPGKERMLAVMVPRVDQVWFFKVTGPEDAIGLIEKEFRKFVSNLQFDESGNPILVQLPEGWRRGGEKRMRFATIDIKTPKKQLDLSISSLGNPAKDTVSWDAYVVQNVDRWRGQLRLGPSEARWSGGVPIKLDAAETDWGMDGKGVWVDFIGEPGGGGMMGAAGSRPPFAGAVPGAMPAAKPPVSPPPAAKQSGVDFEIPKGWRDLPGKSSMRLVSLAAGPEDAEVEISVLPAGGDLRGNVARWMGQVIEGSPDPADVDKMLESAQKLKVSGRDAQRFLITGDASKGQDSIDATIVPLEGTSSMFVKMRGPSETVAQESDSMVTFLQSLSF